MPKTETRGIEKNGRQERLSKTSGQKHSAMMHSASLPECHTISMAVITIS
jgi:hypothetical protein